MVCMRGSAVAVSSAPETCWRIGVLVAAGDVCLLYRLLMDNDERCVAHGDRRTCGPAFCLVIRW